MDRTRASVIGVIAAAAALSGLLWLVPVAARRSADEGADRPRREMTSQEADDQVKAAMDALAAGINLGNPDLALVGFSTEDADWLAVQRQLVMQIIERLQGHGARLHYSHPSWFGHLAGGKEVVSRRVYAGPTVVADTVSGQIVGEIERYAIAPDGRFLFHPFPENDPLLQHDYRMSLGRVYADLGQTEEAFAIWRAMIEDQPDADPSRIAQIYEEMARTHAAMGDLASAYAEYERAYGGLERTYSYTSMTLGGKTVRLSKREQLRLRLAEMAERMGDAATARSWYESLAESETRELADLARQRLEGLQ